MEVDRFRVRKKTLQSVLEQCRRALEQLGDAEPGPTSPADEKEEEEAEEEKEGDRPPDPPADSEYDTDELCDLVKSKVESPDFLEKLGSIHMSVTHCTSDDSASWDMVCAKDLWKDIHVSGDNELDQNGYVLVNQEDIVEGIACFMAAYLLSLEQTKELTPNQLQEVLSKTFSLKKKKTKLRKAWEGSKVIYNVASWSATVIGIYQNPAILHAASVAFCTSWRVISKLL